MQTLLFNANPIKIQTQCGQTWFCAADVAKAIGYKNSAQAITDNVSSKYICQISLGKKGRAPLFISEPGLYELIMKSNLPTAAVFQNWVYEQVLPSIRQTGHYTGQMPLAELSQLMSDLPVLIAKENLAPVERAYKVRNIVTVDYGDRKPREAIILDFLGSYIYVKFLADDKTDFITTNQVQMSNTHK